MKFAPILVVTLNRYDHFKRCINSLKKCTNAFQTDLFIALDYPSKEEHFEGYKKILSFLNKPINEFKSVKIYKRDVNFGVYYNFSVAQRDILEIYDSLIISEDDNEFSLNFIDYMNTCLTKFVYLQGIFSLGVWNLEK